jgi:hypothetical protein
MDQKRVYWLRNKIQGIFIKGTIISMRYQLLCRAREENMNINLAIVAANNHYAGFGPGTANTFKKMLDLSEVTWENVEIPDTEMRTSSNTKQTSLSDFLE